MPRFLDEVGYDELLMGFLYVAWGTRPRDQSIHNTSADKTRLAAPADREPEIVDFTTPGGSIS